MKKLVYIFILLLSIGFVGCKTTTTIDKEYIHDTIQNTVFKYDSVFIFQFDSTYVKDSTYRSEKVVGDTVFVQVDRWHTEYKTKQQKAKEVAKKDSIRVVTNTVYRTVTKTIVKKQSFFESIKQYINNILLTLFVGLLVYIVYKFRYPITTFCKHLIGSIRNKLK